MAKVEKDVWFKGSRQCKNDKCNRTVHAARKKSLIDPVPEEVTVKCPVCHTEIRIFIQ